MSKEFNDQRLRAHMATFAKLMATAVRNQRIHLVLVGFTYCEHGNPDHIQACATFGNDPEGLVDVATMLVKLAEDGGYVIDEEASKIVGSPPEDNKPH